MEFYRLAAGVLLAFGIGLSLSAEDAGSGDTQPVQAPGSKWTIDDLLVDPFGDPIQVAKMLQLSARRSAAATAGSADIGDIAVLVDDGTLVIGNTTNSGNIIAAFYATHTDEYDEVVIHVSSDYPGNVGPEAGFAFFSLTAGFVGGINRFQGNPLENSGFTRLTGFCNMNDLPEYPPDPTQDLLGGVASYVEIMGQEFEHAWGAFVQPTPETNADILGRSDAHWSFFLHHPGVGNASPMEGNRWMELGGADFITVESFTGFCELDEYLMGIRAPEDISPFWVIDFFEGKPFNDSAFPAEGVMVEHGIKRDLTIQDIIDQHGPRGPSVSTSMKEFRVAFILVVPPGGQASAADLDKLNTFRLAWENYFSETTEGLGIMNTTLGVGPAVDPAAFAEADEFESGVIDPARYEYVQGATISTLGMNEPSGSHSLHLNGNWGGGDEVRSLAIDLSGVSSGEATLNYFVQRTGSANSPEPGEDLLVEYFNNADEWIVLVNYPGSGPDEIQYTSVSHVIPDDGLHELFRFRFHRRQGTIGELDDFFIDDVSVAIASSCPADLDGSGTVDAADLAILLGAWGPNPGHPADFNGDNVIDAADLALLLGVWGPCG